MQRIKSLDLARGFTVLMIAPVHTILLYSQPGIYNTFLVKYLAFIAEGPGAQLFMLLMGIYFSFQKPSGFPPVVKRSALLLMAGYTLNIVKFIIPMRLGLLPAGLQSELQVENNAGDILHLLLLGDILHFAAPALIVLFFVKRIKQYQYWALLLAMIICFVSPFCWDIHSSNPFINYLLQLAGGQPPRVFFPLLPWLVYPLMGLSIGYWLQQYGSKTFSWLRNFGVAFIVYGWLLKTFLIKEESVSFYRTLPADTFKHIGIVLITLHVWEWLGTHVTENYFFRLLAYMSQHITQIYFIQWLLIMWLLPVFGYQQLEYESSLAASAFTTFITIAVSVRINSASSKINPYQSL